MEIVGVGRVRRVVRVLEDRETVYGKKNTEIAA